MKSRFKLLAGLLPMFAMILAGCGNNEPQTTKPEEQQQQHEEDHPITPEVVHVTGVSVNPTTLTLDVDETANLTATVAPANANNKNVVWTSDDETVATVSSTGVVTAVFEGETKVHAKTVDGNFDAYCTVTVNEIVIPHFCTHVCPDCGLCLDPTCQDPACSSKCQGHVPTKAFSNGKLMLEAEEGDVTGTMTGTEPGDKFILERNSDNPEHPTSGSIVMNWAAEGNKITWKFKLDEAEAKVAFKLWVACGGSQNSANLKFTINGTQASWDQSSVEGKGFSEGKWYFWTPLTTKGALVQGVNTIVLENLTKDSWNIDCLELQDHYCDHICPICGGCLDADCQDPLCATKCPGHSHTCEHVCEFCEKCTDSECQDVVCAQKCPGHNVIEFTNGKYRIPNASVAGTYKVCAHEAVTVRLEFKADFTSTNLYDGVHPNDNNAVEIWVNEQRASNSKVNFGTSNGLAFPGPTIYTTSGTWNLVKGENTIKIIVPTDTNVTYEWFDIVDSATPVHTCSHTCETCSKCTDIQCIYYQCASNRCLGHNHECQHVCEFCEKCTDSTCLDPKCGNKCPGHNVIEFTDGKYRIPSASAAGTYKVCAHEAVAVRLEFKANFTSTNNNNDNNAVEIWVNEQRASNNKVNFGTSDGHAFPGPTIYTTSGTWNLVKGENTIRIVVPTDTNATYEWFDIVDSATPVHTCSHVCETCSKCTDVQCIYYQCASNRCAGHNHECQHVCQYCSKCTDETCLDPACGQKCAGHNVLDLSSGSMIFESENGYDFAACGPYENVNASNNGGVGGVNGGSFTSGSSYKFEVAVPEDAQVSFIACGALFSENPANHNGLGKLIIDGAEYGNFGCGAVNGTNANYHVYVEYSNSKVITLTAGLHTLTFNGEWGSMANVDYIKIVKYVPETKTVRLEAEYAVRSSDKLEVLSRLSDTDHAISNGLCVGGFSNEGADNTALTFNFNSDKAGVYKMTVWEANCTGLTTFDSAFTVKVNDSPVTASNGTMSALANQKYYLFEGVEYAELTLVEGANKIEFINTAKYGVNIDCIDLEVLKDTTISTPNIARLEAEEGTIKGTIVGTTQYPTHTYAGDTAFKNVNEKDSGGASIGNWASNGDNNFKGYFSVDKDTQVYVVIYVSFASMGELDLLNRFWGIGVDGCIEMTKVTTTANNSIVTDDTYHDWRAIMIAVPYEVTAGQEHYICVDSKQGCPVNFDCFDIIAVDPTATITPIGVPTVA